MTELDELLGQIDRLKTLLDTARPLTSTQLQLAMDIEYTYESNRIEGNTLTLRETDLVVNKGLTVGGKPMREHLEAINHYEAILFIRELAAKTALLDEREVRNIHALVLRGIDRDNAGRYRNLPVMISGSRHVLPQPWAVPKLMEDYGLWLSGESLNLHPVVRAAEAHERLATIHPFIDGNGRTARLVMNLVLLSNGMTITNIPGDTDSRRAYYDALEKVNLERDKREFINFIARHVLQAMQTLLERLGAA